MSKTLNAQVAALQSKERKLTAQLTEVRKQRAALQQLQGYPTLVIQMAKAFDNLGIPVDSPKRVALPKARKHGLHASNAVMEAALKYRRQLAAVNS